MIQSGFVDYRHCWYTKGLLADQRLEVKLDFAPPMQSQKNDFIPLLAPPICPQIPSNPSVLLGIPIIHWWY